MKWRRGRQSDNVEDQRGGRGGGRRVRGAGGLGIGGLAVLVLVGWVMGVSPTEMLSLLGTSSSIEDGSSASRSTSAPANDPQTQFIRTILGETELTWSAIFQAQGEAYRAPKLTLFAGRVRSACGMASSAVGPFYCPADYKIYLDTEFFGQMTRSLGGGGDFAEAYVIAHEVGHHVQTLLGISAQVHRARRRGENVEGAEGLLVRQELQADCYAGVWGHSAQQRHQWLEPGDIEEALRTASAIGDDRLQRQSGGSVVPDSFTHGSSEQRERWFRIGFDSGDPSRCNTFRAARL